MINKTTLNNGLTVISEFVPGIESFALGVCVNVGSSNDYKGKEGIAHFMEHAAFRHTTKRTAKQIANEFENLGGYVNAFTTKENTCYYARAITEHFPKIFELIADVATNTTFVPKDIEKERTIILEEIKSYEDDPEENISDIIDTLVFAGSTFAPPIIGSQQSVAEITIADLEKLRADFYFPANMLVAVAGKIEHDWACELANKFFDISAKPRKATASASINIDRNAWKKSIKSTENVRQIQQSHLMLGTLAEGYRSAERYPLAIANAIFGEGMSSRLYQVLREKFGLAYSIYSTINNYLTCGAINIYAATDDANLQRTADLIFEEMHKLNSNRIPTKNELKRAKEQLKTATIIDLESMSARMQILLKQILGLGRFESNAETLALIEQVTMDDIVQLNSKYFVDDMWCKSVLLPGNM